LFISKYAANLGYIIKAGVWSAMGFPVESQTARARFYHYSNWSYQVGVFVSRSSGILFRASLPVLWLMPALQVLNLLFFWLDSVQHFWYNNSLLSLCFFAGLLGGGVYVQGFSRINLDLPVDLREFAIASAGVADSLGILTADICSLFIQVRMPCHFTHCHQLLDISL
jgi:battenin